jgi:hypothetical protein
LKKEKKTGTHMDLDEKMIFPINLGCVPNRSLAMDVFENMCTEADRVRFMV